MTDWPSADKWLPQRLLWLLSSSCCCYKGTTQRPGETCGETLWDHSHQRDGGEASGLSFPLLTVSHCLNHWATVYQMPPLRHFRTSTGWGNRLLQSTQTSMRAPGPRERSSDPTGDWVRRAWECARVSTRARLSFPHSQSLPSGNLHKPLILIHQRADRSSKNYNSTASRSKDTTTES